MPRTNTKRRAKKGTTRSAKKTKKRSTSVKGGKKVGKLSGAKKLLGKVLKGASSVATKAENYGIDEEQLKGWAGKIQSRAKAKRGGRTMGYTRRSSVAKLRNRIQKKLLKLREYKVNRLLLREQLRV